MGFIKVCVSGFVPSGWITIGGRLLGWAKENSHRECVRCGGFRFEEREGPCRLCGCERFTETLVNVELAK